MTPQQFCEFLATLEAQQIAYIVGLTGSVGVGKSTVASFVSAYYPVLNADRIAKECYRIPQVLEQIHDVFPAIAEKIAQEEFAQVAQLVFTDKKTLQAIKQILYPFVYEALARQTEEYAKSGKKIIFHESALLVEEQLHHCYSYIVCVEAPADLQQRWLPLELQQTFLQRQKMQVAASAKKSAADYVIRNDSDLPTLRQKTLRFLHWLDHHVQGSSRRKNS